MLMNVLTDMVTDMNDLDEKPSSTAPEFGAGERAFVYAIARRIVGSPEAAEDVAQDAMLLAYVHRDAFRGDSRFRTWLYRVASTAALGHLRKVKRSREVLNLEDGTVPALRDPSSSPEAIVAHREAVAIASQLLADLEPAYRDVVVLRSEHTEADTAKRLGITIANVKVRAHRARAKLRTAFEQLPTARAA
jgi:RNA polymerase sigma-70 factor (ECF subfamily)